MSISAEETGKLTEYNRTGLDYRKPMPKPKVRGRVIDFHCHLLAAQHGEAWFEAADHYGIDDFVTMTQLEEAVGLQRRWGERIRFIAVPNWHGEIPNFVDDWLRRIEGFYNLGSRVVKFHVAPGTMDKKNYRLDSESLRPIFREAADRKMGIMTHVGDPDLWYATRYQDASRFGTREEHYQMWENMMREYPQTPWVGAHMGGNPEDLRRLQSLLDRYPNLSLDCSATKWIVRELSKQRDAARDFFIRNQDRILFGSDQVSGDNRGFDFLASRFWVHRKMWETAYVGTTPIHDSDLPDDQQPMIRGLALPDQVLQKLYHDNAVKYLEAVNSWQ